VKYESIVQVKSDGNVIFKWLKFGVMKRSKFHRNWSRDLPIMGKFI